MAARTREQVHKKKPCLHRKLSLEDSCCNWKSILSIFPTLQKNLGSSCYPQTQSLPEN